MDKYTLITGAGCGLGKELALIYASRNNNLLLVDINEKNLNEVKKEILKLNSNIKVGILVYDLTLKENLKSILKYTVDNNIFVNRLINGAGFGDRNDFKDMDIDTQLKMNALNVDALLYFTRVFLDDMLKNKEGEVLNISSIAGFMPGTYMCTYHATKAYVLNLGEALSCELKGSGVTLTTLCPGPFLSNFVKVAGNDYTFKKIKPVTAKKVAELGVKALDKKKHFYIVGFKNRLTCFGIRFLPRNLVAKLSGDMMKKK